MMHSVTYIARLSSLWRIFCHTPDFLSHSFVSISSCWWYCRGWERLVWVVVNCCCYLCSWRCQFSLAVERVFDCTFAVLNYCTIVQLNYCTIERAIAYMYGSPGNCDCESKNYSRYQRLTEKNPSESCSRLLVLPSILFTSPASTNEFFLSDVSVSVTLAIPNPGNRGKCHYSLKMRRDENSAK